MNNILSINTAVTLAVLLLVVIIFIGVAHIRKNSLKKDIKNMTRWALKGAGRFVRKKERELNRDLETGRKKDSKTYRFLNDLTIDIGLKKLGMTPYMFLFMVMVISFVLGALLSQILFGGWGWTIVLFPISGIMTICLLYTKANIEHDKRIDEIIEVECLISNTIRNGVVVAVRENITLMPEKVRGDYEQFLYDVQEHNFHIQVALEALADRLGSSSEEFIRKCIAFETNDESGLEDSFKDTVLINNIRMQQRIEMRKTFESVTRQFAISVLMIFVFLGGVIAMYPVVRDFYFTNFFGQLLIIIDMLIVIGEFVYITYLRAKNV